MAVCRIQKINKNTLLHRVHDRRALQQLALNVHFKHSDPDLTTDLGGAAVQPSNYRFVGSGFASQVGLLPNAGL